MSNNEENTPISEGIVQVIPVAFGNQNKEYAQLHEPEELAENRKAMQTVELNTIELKFKSDLSYYGLIIMAYAGLGVLQVIMDLEHSDFPALSRKILAVLRIIACGIALRARYGMTIERQEKALRWFNRFLLVNFLVLIITVFEWVSVYSGNVPVDDPETVENETEEYYGIMFVLSVMLFIAFVLYFIVWPLYIRRQAKKFLQLLRRKEELQLELSQRNEQEEL